MDEAAMNQAFSTLHDQFGDQLAGDQIKGEVKMRAALMTQLNVDEAQADLMVKQLIHTSWIRFHNVGGDVAGTVTTTPDAGANQPEAWTEDSQPIPLGSPQMDQSLMMEPMLAAAAAQPGMATGAGSNAGGALGVALVGAPAAKLGREALDNGGADDPTVNQDMVNSEAADEHRSDPRGYWQISGPPSAAAIAASGGGV